METEIETHPPKPAIPDWLTISFLVISAAGFADATYLTAKHFLGSPVTCSILQGCEQVTTSQYALILGIPVALLGSLYYLTLLILTGLYFQTKHRFLFLTANLITIAGFLASLRFVYLQIFVIKALCIFCMGSAITSTILFVLTLIALKKKPTL